MLPYCKARVAVRITNRCPGRVGWLISGRDCWDRSVRIFAEDWHVADHIRRQIKAGHEINFEDFAPRV